MLHDYKEASCCTGAAVAGSRAPGGAGGPGQDQGIVLYNTFTVSHIGGGAQAPPNHVVGGTMHSGPPNSDTSGPVTKHTVFVKINSLLLINPHAITYAMVEVFWPYRSFSAMRRLKTCLRSTMSTERLNSFMTLHVHKDLLDCIDDCALFVQWLRTLLRVTKFERTFLERG